MSIKSGIEAEEFLKRFDQQFLGEVRGMIPDFPEGEEMR